MVVEDVERVTSKQKKMYRHTKILVDYVAYLGN